MKIILIIMVFSGQYATRNTEIKHIEFDNIGACQVAKDKIAAADSKSTTTTVFADCFPKG